MKVIIVGCGRLGSDLAYRLFRRGHSVSVIDISSAAFNNLPTDFEGRLNEGDALSQDVLHRAGIENADALAVVTDSDALNAVIGRVARDEYHVANVIVRNYDPQSRPILEAFDFQLVSASVWGAQRVEELISHQEMRTIFSSGNGEVEIYEFTIPQSWAGRMVSELISGENNRAVTLSHAGKAVIPADTDKFAVGDVLLVSATFEGAEEVGKRLGIRK